MTATNTASNVILLPGGSGIGEGLLTFYIFYKRAAGIFMTLPIHIVCKYQNIYLCIHLFAKRHPTCILL